MDRNTFIALYLSADDKIKNLVSQILIEVQPQTEPLEKPVDKCCKGL